MLFLTLEYLHLAQIQVHILGMKAPFCQWKYYQNWCCSQSWNGVPRWVLGFPKKSFSWGSIWWTSIWDPRSGPPPNWPLMVHDNLPNFLQFCLLFLWLPSYLGGLLPPPEMPFIKGPLPPPKCIAWMVCVKLTFNSCPILVRGEWEGFPK